MRVIASLALVLSSLTLSGAAPATRARPHLAPGGFQGEHAESTAIDTRSGGVQPSAVQRSIASRLGGDVRWNRFGTPHSLIRHGGFLSPRLARSPVSAARSFLADNHELFRLTRADASGLELIGKSKIGRGFALLFRQRFAGL